jgi:hypothetical protein
MAASPKANDETHPSKTGPFKMSFSRHKLTRSENMERLTPAAQSPESLVYLHMSQRPFLIALGLAPDFAPSRTALGMGRISYSGSFECVLRGVLNCVASSAR